MIELIALCLLQLSLTLEGQSVASVVSNSPCKRPVFGLDTGWNSGGQSDLPSTKPHYLPSGNRAQSTNLAHFVSSKSESDRAVHSSLFTAVPLSPSADPALGLAGQSVASYELFSWQTSVFGLDTG